MAKLNLGFLCSHGGSNMQAIVDNINSGKLDATACAVISNNATAFAITRAQNANIPNYIVNEKTFPNQVDEEIIRIFKSHNVDTIILAGYMKLVSELLISSFNNRVLNIHPALLPKFGGKCMYGNNVHKAVIEANETVSGATVHLVNSEYDKGRILGQAEVPVLVGDTTETLARRVLETEHKLYSSVLIKISQCEIVI